MLYGKKGLLPEKVSHLEFTTDKRYVLAVEDNIENIVKLIIMRYRNIKLVLRR